MKSARQVCRVCFNSLLPTQTTYCSPRCFEHGKSLKEMGERKKKKPPILNKEIKKKTRAEKRESVEIKNLRFKIAQLKVDNQRLRGELKKYEKPIIQPQPASFYDSREWQVLRYRVIQTYGRKCMACGETIGAMHVDHIKPRSKYPDLELEFSNLQVLCGPCNKGKGAWDETDFRNP